MLPVLVDAGATFKLPSDLEGFNRINSGAAGASQIGKIVTVYPASDSALAALVARLAERWSPEGAPAVPSDLEVTAGRGLYVRYGVFRSEPGTLLASDGSTRADQRGVLGEQPPWAPRPPVPTTARDGAAVMAPITIDGIRFLPLKLLADRPKGRTVLALNLSDCATAVVRSARPGVESDESGQDAVTRLGHEREVLDRLAGSGIAPEVLGHDPVGGCLAVSDVGGRALDGEPADRWLELLPGLAAVLARLHERGLAHRDVKLANARITDAGEVVLVDLEAAAPVGTRHPVPLGTDGYVPPEGPRSVVDPSYDAYALGSCLTHAVLRYCPGRLPRDGNAGRQLALLALHGQRTAAKIVRRLHDPDPRRRPSATATTRLLTDNLPSLRQEAGRGAGLDRRWAATAAIDAGRTTRRFRQVDDGGWRTTTALPGLNPEGINVGAAGVILGLLTIDTALRTAQFDDDVLTGAEWLARRDPTTDTHGLFTGNSGVAVALAVTGHRYGRDDLVTAAARRLSRAAEAAPHDADLFSGAAGLIWAACLIDAVDPTGWALPLVENHVARLRDSAENFDGVTGWRPAAGLGPAGGAYVGAAHGTAGAALALAAWGRRAGCAATLAAAESAFRSVLAHGLAPKADNTLATTSGEVRAAHHWCHGVAGVLWCLLQAYPDGVPEEKAEAGRMFAAGEPRLDNPTLCHGLSGVLENWRMLGAVPGFHGRAPGRIAELAGVLRCLHSSFEGSTSWSVGGREQVAPDLWIGLLGPATQLALAACGSRHALLSEGWLRCLVARDPGHRG
ncbi:lanthionine synthetase LanC family protein [Actinoplanes solisilvae]|uniref:lanthionine synthetase LanC family protein n=1 Tax=Actinoplanes solisilvae TaxID=2486853 RepID=UPI000FDA4E8F|nr:lanthionine synthetase LanC family protein [Actinoplanes solisilvae]